MSGFSELKRAARQAIHEAFVVPALYSDQAWTNQPVGVRWHNRLIRQGNLAAAGYAELIEGVDRLVFSRKELLDLGLVLQRDGVIVIPAYGGAMFTLDTLEPPDGPVDIVWNVVKADV